MNKATNNKKVDIMNPKGKYRVIMCKRKGTGEESLRKRRQRCRMTVI